MVICMYERAFYSYTFKTFHVMAMKRDEAIFYAQFRCPGYHKSVIATAQSETVLQRSRLRKSFCSSLRINFINYDTIIILYQITYKLNNIC